MHILWFSAILAVAYVCLLVFCFGTTRDQVVGLLEDLEAAAPTKVLRTARDIPHLLAIMRIKKYKFLVEIGFGLFGLSSLASAACRCYAVLQSSGPVLPEVARHLEPETPILLLAGIVLLCLVHWNSRPIARWLS